jgi:hypothetical protein
MALETLIATICLVATVIFVQKSRSKLRTFLRAAVGLATGIVVCVVEGSIYGDARTFLVCGLVWACIAAHVDSGQRTTLRVVKQPTRYSKPLERLAS